MIRIIAMERVVRSNKRLRMILLGGNMADKEIGFEGQRHWVWSYA